MNAISIFLLLLVALLVALAVRSLRRSGGRKRCCRDGCDGCKGCW